MTLPTCHELLDFLADYLADDLPADTRCAFDRHLSLCPDCVNYLENYRATLLCAKTACAAPPGPLPESLVQAILRSRGS